MQKGLVTGFELEKQWTCDDGLRDALQKTNNGCTEEGRHGGYKNGGAITID